MNLKMFGSTANSSAFIANSAKRAVALRYCARPKTGVTIVRDASYGVPHIYGATHGDVMFGAGYAAAPSVSFDGVNLVVTFTPVPVPEPAGVLLACAAGAGLAGWLRRGRQR